MKGALIVDETNKIQKKMSNLLLPYSEFHDTGHSSVEYTNILKI